MASSSGKLYTVASIISLVEDEKCEMEIDGPLSSTIPTNDDERLIQK